jgi:DNA-binding transcriptional regulator of glucitol operon
VLALLGNFAALPSCHKPLVESFEFGLQQKRRQGIKKLADAGFASACAVCGGLSCGSVQKYLIALPDAQRTEVLQMMREMQAEEAKVTNQAEEEEEDDMNETNASVLSPKEAANR